MITKRRSGLAKVSLVLGLVGFFFALSRAGLLLVLAIPLGGIALACGVTAVIKIYRKDGMLRGGGLAISGICLGAASSFFSVVALAGVFLQEFNFGQRPPQQHHHPGEWQHMAARSSFRNEPATNFTSNLPIIVLERHGNHVSNGERTMVRAKFYNVENGRATLGTKPSYDGYGTINVRGHSTAHYPKQSYSFHVVDERGTQIKAPLLGMPAEEDWVLYAPFEDKSLMRDVLAYELARKMGHYAPRTRFVEMFIKDNSRGTSMRDYMGVYVLVERIKRGKERVNIAKLDKDVSGEPEISGGYIVKRDHSEGGGGRFRTQRGGPFFYVYPKARDITSAQKTWIRNYFIEFEEALYSENFTDPREGYAAYLDVDAFLDLHWLVELSKNVDGFRYSAYLTKDRNGKLKPGPAWDWNRAFGNANYYGGQSTKGWYWSVLRPNEISWHQRLREDPEYVKRAAEKWMKLREDVLHPEKISQMIDHMAAQLEQAQARNFQRWPILGSHVGSNSFMGQSHQEEVDWLKKWITSRIRWIDSQVAVGKL